MQGHGTYPDTDKQRTDAVDPCDSKTLTWPAGGPSLAGCLWWELTTWMWKRKKVEEQKGVESVKGEKQ